MIAEGRPVMPVMIDTDAPRPEFLKPRARRSTADFAAIADAILGRDQRPLLESPPAQAG